MSGQLGSPRAGAEWHLKPPVPAAALQLCDVAHQRTLAGVPGDGRVQFGQQPLEGSTAVAHRPRQRQVERALLWERCGISPGRKMRQDENQRPKTQIIIR